jgi:pyruvate formate lyase activating enzyme
LWDKLKLTTGCILELKEGSIDDGPGIRTVVFLKGCPLNCQWCHSPESRSFFPQLVLYRSKCVLCGKCEHLCPQKVHQVADEHHLKREACLQCGLCVDNCSHAALEIIGQTLKANELVDMLLRHRVFFQNSGGGITFSGGEATSQYQFLLALLCGCKLECIHTALDTSGCISWGKLCTLLEYTDLLLYDLKHLDEARHKYLTGVSNKLILSNLCKLKDHKTNVVVRIPLIPKINDDPAHLHAVGQFLSQTAKQERVELLPYNELAAAKYDWIDMSYELGELKRQTSEHLDNLRSVLEAYNLKVSIR